MAQFNKADLNLQGKVYTGGNVAAKSVIAVAAATTGLALYNPISSRKKLVVLDAGWSWTTVPGALHNIGIGIVAASSLAPTSVTIAGAPARRADGSGVTGFGMVADAITFATAPVAARWMGGAAWVSGASVGPYYLMDNIDGGLVVVPGAAVALIALTTTAVGVGHFTWAEIDV